MPATGAPAPRTLHVVSVEAVQTVVLQGCNRPAPKRSRLQPEGRFSSQHRLRQPAAEGPPSVISTRHYAVHGIRSDAVGDAAKPPEWSGPEETGNDRSRIRRNCHRAWAGARHFTGSPESPGARFRRRWPAGVPDMVQHVHYHV
eukprot:gene18060-biopygen2384